ncbi:MAG: ABC transporter permease [Lachnospiraceae bacterium]|nr:ABC transporter permease [Lachnospiraceae bacterium]
MFGHIFRYALKALARTRVLLFWTLAFPFMLSTFMYLAFGNIFESTEQFHVIPAAVVQKEASEIFDPMLSAVSGDGDDALLSVTKVEEEEAEKMLEDGKVKGIIFVDRDAISLKVKENGMDETVLQMVLNQFLRYKKTVADVAVANPERIDDVIASLSSQVDYFVEAETSKGNQDDTTNFFYAVFAMTCLFASFAGCDRILKIQANATDLGKRRGVAPIHKLKGILAEFCACELVQYLMACLLFLYMQFVLGIDFGTKYPAILLLLFAGTSFGNMFGILIGSLPRLGEGAKIGILISFNMLLCVLADLVANGIRALIERHLPILNDINPAALIVDGFYALNIYDTYHRYLGNVLALCGLTAVCTVICYFLVRRNRYASL